MITVGKVRVFTGLNLFHNVSLGRNYTEVNFPCNRRMVKNVTNSTIALVDEVYQTRVKSFYVL